MTDVTVEAPASEVEGPTDPVGAEVDAAVDQLSPYDRSKRRFTVAVLVGTAVVSVPYLWVLWDLWSGGVTALRAVEPDNFYELQARAMFAGHLWVRSGSLGIEGFLHGGHTFTYFGIWPSLIRMPVLAFTHAYDGRLTAPSLLIAWSLTCVFTALLIWRVRVLIRGDAVLGRAEAASYGALMAAILGGSVLIFIAANPSTYDEDFAWSVALVMGSLFTLLGMVERPTRGGAVASGLLILAANLNRSPTGYACVITAFLVAGWFALGKGGRDNRRWAIWMAGAGGFSLVASMAVTYAKFGLPFGLPMADQVWAHINAHRRYFLAANGGKAFSLSFIPSTFWAYTDPTAIRFSSVFPFIAAPPTPAHAVTGVVLDQTYATTSITAASPLLFVLSCWGLVTAFRPRGFGGVRLTRIILLGAMAATAGVLVWGYIAYRYVSDLMPLLILASAIGLVDIWRRLDGRSPGARRRVLGAVMAGAAFGIAANLAITATPSTWFSMVQLQNFVGAQHSTTPVALRGTVVRGDRLPYYAPAGQLFVAGDCVALYRSTGDSFTNSPGQQIMHAVWSPVEQSAPLVHTVSFSFSHDRWDGPPVSLLTYGAARLELRPTSDDRAYLALVHGGAPKVTWPDSFGFPFPQISHLTLEITVVTDPYLQSLKVDWYHTTMLNRFLAGSGPATVTPTATATGGPPPVVTVAEVPTYPPDMRLCKALSHR